MAMEHEAQKLTQAVHSFVATVDQLPEELFLSSIGRWTVRDIVAHLIGWNRYLIRGAAEIIQGQLPFYDQDPGENFSKINAQHLLDYPSKEKQTLMQELITSANEVEQFILSMDPERWNHDYGVRHKGNIITVHNSFDDLTEDYDHHQRQIDSLLTNNR